MKRGRKYLPYLLVYINYPTNPIWSAECRPHSSCVAGKKRRFRHPFEPKRHLLRPVCVIAFPFRLFSLFILVPFFYESDTHFDQFEVTTDMEMCSGCCRKRFVSGIRGSHLVFTTPTHSTNTNAISNQSKSNLVFRPIFLPTPLFFDPFVTRYQSFFPFRSFLLFLGPARDHYVFLSSWYLAFHRCIEIKRNKKNSLKLDFFFAPSLFG